METIMNFLNQTGFSMIAENPKVLAMLLIACVLMYLAIVRKFEPLLLVTIAFGMLLTNLPGAEVFHEELFAGGHVHWNLFGASNAITPGLIDILYLGLGTLLTSLILIVESVIRQFYLPNITVAPLIGFCLYLNEVGKVKS